MPLRGIRVGELGSGFALAYCGRIFSELGASVKKVRSPAGDIAEYYGPLIEGAGSALLGWANAGKTLCDITELEGLDGPEFQAAIGELDVLLCALDGADERARRLHARLVGSLPSITVDISWFGSGGPYSDFVATDDVCRALAGLTQAIGPAQGPPMLRNGHDAEVAGGVAAFSAAVSGLLGSGRRHFAISLLEANVELAELQIASSIGWGGAQPRYGINRLRGNFPMGVYATKAGWLGIIINTPGQWRSFCEVLEAPELFADRGFRSKTGRWARADELDSIITPRLLVRTAEEWFQLGLKHKLPFAVVPSLDELIRQPVFRERRVFTTTEFGGRVFEAPSVPFRPALQALGRDAPPTLTAMSGVVEGDATNSLPLAGIRILDLTMGWAGPLATRQLADLGAELIKVESEEHPDWWRGTENSVTEDFEKSYEKRMQFLLMNRNKLGVELDLKIPEHRQIFMDLLPTVDAVINNFSAGTLERLGLDYETLRKANPRIISLSMSAFGSNNAWSRCRAYGPTLEQAAGLPFVNRGADEVPVHFHVAYGDPMGGINGAAAALVALFRQRRTGEGGAIDLSQVEMMLPLMTEAVIEQSLTGNFVKPAGNRHKSFVPNGCFKCSGADDWVVVSATDTRQWHALCAVLDRHDWAADTVMEDPGQRRAREDEIEQAIANWCIGRTAEVAMNVLQRAGVPAGLVRNPFDLLKDAHLMARGYWQMIDRQFVGEHAQASPTFREGASPYPIRHPAPTLGEHSEWIFTRLYGDQASARLGEGRVEAELPLPKRADA